MNSSSKIPEPFKLLMGAELSAALHVARLLQLAADNSEFVARLAQANDAPQWTVKRDLTTGLQLAAVNVSTMQEKIIVALPLTRSLRGFSRHHYLYIPFTAAASATTFSKWVRLECGKLAAAACDNLVREELKARAHSRRMLRLNKATVALVRRHANAAERKAAAVKKGGVE